MSNHTWFLVAALVLSPTAASAQTEKPTDPEKTAKLERKGAGVRGGAWWPQDLRKESDAAYAQTPWFEGYFQEGLDLHLALDTAVGFWRRTQEIERTDALGGTSRQEVQTYIVPLFTALKIYPLTRPQAGVEPFLTGGIGLALGIDDRRGDGDLMGTRTGTTILGGFGFKLGGGLDWKLGRALGVTVGARYQWIRFGEEIGGERTYRGFGVDVGLAYRFQYQ